MITRGSHNVSYLVAANWFSDRDTTRMFHGIVPWEKRTVGITLAYLRHTQSLAKEQLRGRASNQLVTNGWRRRETDQSLPVQG